MRSPDPTRPRRRRVWRLAALALSALAVVAVAVLWSARLEIARWAALRELEAAGLGPAQLTIDRLGLHELHARDIALRGGALQAAELGLAYAPGELVKAHLDEVAVTGLRLALVLDAGGLTVGGRPLGAGTASDGTSPTARLRIDALKIAGAELALDGPSGRFQATLSSTLALAGTDLRDGSIAADVVVPIAGSPRTLRIVAPKLDLLPQAGGGLRFAFERAAVTSTELPWSADGIGGELVWQPDQATAKIVIDKLADRETPALVVPLRLSGTATLAGAHVDFALQVEAAAAGRKGKLGFEAKGRHDRSAGSGSASIAMGPVVFQSSGVQPADFFPAFGAAVADVTGQVAVSGSVKWHGTAVTPDLAVRLSDVGFDAKGTTLSRIAGDIRLVELWPPATPPGQALSFVVEAAGLPASEATLGFQLRQDSSLMVERMRLAFAGGFISASPFAIRHAAPELATVLGLDQVDLAELFKLIGVVGLSGSGRLVGQIPLKLAGGRVRISQGKIAATGPGVLNYKSDKLPQEITGAGEQMQLALHALDDFHYDSLALELDENVSGEGSALLHLQGNNPAVLKGQKFNFNIRIESNFDRLTDLALRSMTSAQELLRQAERSMRP